MRRESILFWLIVGLCPAVLLALELKAPYVNGPYYWQWPWIDLGFWRSAVRMAWPLPVFFTGAWLAETVSPGPRAGRRVWGALALLALAAFGFQVGGALADHRGWLMVPQLVRSPEVTSYFTDALAIDDIGGWLGRFHELGFSDLGPHSKNKPHCTSPTSPHCRR